MGTLSETGPAKTCVVVSGHDLDQTTARDQSTSSCAISTSVMKLALLKINTMRSGGRSTGLLTRSGWTLVGTSVRSSLEDEHWLENRCGMVA